MAKKEVYISEVRIKDLPKKPVGLVLRDGAVIGTGSLMSPLTDEQINTMTN